MQVRYDTIHLKDGGEAGFVSFLCQKRADEVKV